MGICLVPFQTWTNNNQYTTNAICRNKRNCALEVILEYHLKSSRIVAKSLDTEECPCPRGFSVHRKNKNKSLLQVILLSTVAFVQWHTQNRVYLLSIVPAAIIPKLRLKLFFMNKTGGSFLFSAERTRWRRVPPRISTSHTTLIPSI